VLNGAVANGGPTRTADYETVTLQSDYSTAFKAWGMKHEFLTGVEYLKENSIPQHLRNRGGTTAGNPPWYRPLRRESPATAGRFNSDSYAVYAQDTVEFIPQWKATLGVRRDQMDAHYSSATSPKLAMAKTACARAVLPPDGRHHYYLSWSDSFSPTADLYQLTVTPTAGRAQRGGRTRRQVAAGSRVTSPCAPRYTRPPRTGSATPTSNRPRPS
jgi:catecholate siderophore receptor